MILQTGQRVYWGAPEVIYLEGVITKLDEKNQGVLVRVERATPNSAHLIGAEIPFAAAGVTPLRGESPAGLTETRDSQRQAVDKLSDAEKIRYAAAAAVHQKYGAALSEEQRQAMIAQVAEILNADEEMRARIIASMDQVLAREG